jgi:putative ABC transport system permease protein
MNDWRIAWTLARRELDWRFRGLRLLLVCLFIGVATLAAIGSLADAIGRELGARGQVILGGDLEFSVSGRDADPAESAAMQRIGTVSTSRRMQASAVAGELIVPVQLKAIDTRYPLYGTLLVDGRRAAAPPADVAFITPALADRLGRDSSFRLGTATFRVGGIVTDEPDRLSEGFSLGPVVMVSQDGLARTGLIQPGSLYESKYRIATSRDAQGAVDTFRKQFEVGGWEARTRDRASPGAARFVTRMGEFLVLVGLAALVIAGIGIGNGVASYLAARRGNIAMLKVLGGTSGLIARVYLIQVGLVGLIGTLLGLLVGLAAVPAIVTLAGDALPVRPDFAVEWRALVTAAAFGLLTALGFAAAPLVAAAQVPSAALLRGAADARGANIRRALPWIAGAALAVTLLAVGSSAQPLLAGGFLAAVAGVLLLLTGLGVGIRWTVARLPKPRAPFPRLALAALHRPGARTAALVVALGVGLTLFVLLASIRSSIDGNIARTIPAKAPALFALDVPRDRAAEFTRAVQTIVPGATVATVPLMRGTITGYGTTRVADLKELPEGAWALRGERGLTYSESLPAGSTLTAGQWWPKGYSGPPLVSVDERLRDVLGLKIGDPLSFTLLGVERTARIASFRRIDWDTLGFNFVLVFSPNAIADAPHNLSATIEMPPGRDAEVVRALNQRFPSTSVVEVRNVLAQVRDVVGTMAAAIGWAASVTVLAGIAVLIGATAAAREARTYDSVMLRLLGATRRQVLTVQALEYLLLAVVVAGVALLLGLTGAWFVVTQMFEFVWLPDWTLVAITLLAGTLVTLAIGLAGSWPVLSARPARALREL